MMKSRTQKIPNQRLQTKRKTRRIRKTRNQDSRSMKKNPTKDLNENPEDSEKNDKMQR